MKKKQEIPVTFQIKAVELIDYCLNVPSKPLPTEMGYQFDISLEHRPDPEKNIFAVVCSVTIFNETREELLGKLRSGCVYLIKDLGQYANTSSKVIELPEPIVTALNSVSISTTRGLMFSIFRGTFLHHAVLPIVDPTSFVMQNK